MRVGGFYSLSPRFPGSLKIIRRLNFYLDVKRINCH